MASSIPAVIDRLVSLASQAVSSAADDDWIVSDGWPSALGERMFGVGTDRPPEGGEGTASDGAVGWKDLGAHTVEEDYDVPCWIYVGSGGTEQAAVRDTAFAVWDLWFALFRTDLLRDVVSPYPAQITNFRSESPKSADEAKNGRYCLILFNVHCQNRY